MEFNSKTINLNFIFSICSVLLNFLQTVVHTCARNYDLIYYQLATGFYYMARNKHSERDNTKTDLVEIGWGDVDWFGLTQDRHK